MEKFKKVLEGMSETVTVTKLDGVLLITVSALAGIILGMLCSPRKNARYGCNSENTMICGRDEGESEDDDSEDIIHFC